ncbi:multidrug resistance protein B [Croceicoccus estronivorus]|uniref:DHA2 family efflux MFS transporter permease subunit n=1 Tax=Croceicoccus estronivorus TaxID=1172626 RepID=UPI0008376D60|nr:DHA2 family efflux MFS transporter permease subunit [Croceicoccus estronivorus]OCC22409.1 multidrug resistance protein B [Croceicoccus estronivorus]
MTGPPPSYTLIAPSRRFIAGIVLALSNFMVVLDMTIANVSVPHIAGNLGISASQGTWVITSYAVSEAICVPLTGWLAQRFGAVRVFVASMCGFGLFSMLCGLSPTLDMLVLCRVGQGLCGGPIMPMSQTLLLRLYPPEMRGRAMGTWAMTTLLGPAMGPILGGMISDNWSWHWIFFINVPIAILGVMATLALLRPLETESRPVPIDSVGLFLLVFWIGCLQIMLDIGREHDWFGDPMVVALAIGAIVGFVVFVIWELTEEHPVVNLRVFANPGFTFGVIALALCFGTYFASIVIIPQWLQMSMGYTATLAGIATAFTAMSALTTSAIAARLLGRVDPRIMVSCAVAWLGLMALWRATHWTSEADFWTIALPQMVQGVAMPFFIVPLTAITLGAVPPSDTASAAGLQNFLRTMAAAIAASVVLTLWDDSQRVAHNEIVSNLRPDDVLRELGNNGFPTDQAWQMVANIANDQAIAVAVNHVFLLSSFALFFAAAIVWLSPKPKGPVDQSAAH